MRIHKGMLRTIIFALTVFLAPLAAAAQDWPEWRGPNQDGTSAEKNLPEKWTPGGAGQLWMAPYGGRSSPVVFGDHLYIQNVLGKGATEQERVMCFNADTGKLLWEHKMDLFHSDSPPHRVGWASPTVDPETGNVYVMGVGGLLVALSKDGKVIWDRSLTEEFGLITTHGGRTVSPMIEGNKVFMSGVTFGWGAQARGGSKFFAFDKKTGDVIWISAPEGIPTDTIYPPLMTATVNGMRVLISGASDGAIHALKLETGEPVWRYPYSKRGVNTGVLMMGNMAFISHSEENLETNEMGMIALLDTGSLKGNVPLSAAKWKYYGYQSGFSSPVTDGKLIYQVDNGANLLAFDAQTGERKWQLKLGTIQRASPVLADGKLYVGTENGKFYILRPRADGADILSEHQFGEPGDDAHKILGSAAVSRGRIFFVTEQATYAIGKKAGAVKPAPYKYSAPTAPAGATPAAVQVLPTEIILRPGESRKFRARLFDENGNFIGESEAQWTVEQLPGSIAADGTYTATDALHGRAGVIKATVGGISGSARVRVIPAPPWNEDFESYPEKAPPPHWINMGRKYSVQVLDGNKVLAKRAEIQHSFYQRARAFTGTNELSNYTTESDVMARQVRRSMGDAGVVAQGYTLVMFGNHQKLDIQSWQPETERIVSVPFQWKPDVWYRMKVRVENLPNGSVRVQGKVWPRDEAEPAAWTIEKTDPIGVRKGAPGVFGSTQSEMFFDNFKVTPNAGAGK